MKVQKKELSSKEFNAKFSQECALRKEAFKELKKHLLEGYSLDSFSLMSEKTIYESMKNYPLEFIVEEFEEILRKAKAGWENIGRQQALGNCVGNSRSWFYNMANRYGWSDKQKVETSGNSQLTVSIVDYASSKRSVE